MQMDAVQREAVAVGINEATLTEVLRVSNLSSASALDPVEFCLLLVTTAADNIRSLVDALTAVFGEAGMLDAELCRELFATLAKHNPRLGGDLLVKLDEQLPVSGPVEHNVLVEIPCIKAMCA
jgi:hypothetical protein